MRHNKERLQAAQSCHRLPFVSAKLHARLVTASLACQLVPSWLFASWVPSTRLSAPCCLGTGTNSPRQAGEHAWRTSRGRSNTEKTVEEKALYALQAPSRQGSPPVAACLGVSTICMSKGPLGSPPPPPHWQARRSKWQNECCKSTYSSQSSNTESRRAKSAGKGSWRTSSVSHTPRDIPRSHLEKGWTRLCVPVSDQSCGMNIEG